MHRTQEGYRTHSRLSKKIYLYPMRLLYPPRCTFCQDILPLTVDKLLCYYCHEAYPLIEDPVCQKCGKQLAHDDDLCLDCKITIHQYEQGVAIYPYEGAIKEAVYRFKYGGKRKYAQFFAEMMYYKLKKTTFFYKIDLIVPVPVSKERFEERGYNQAEELVRYLSNMSKIPCNIDKLVRQKHTKPQSGFSPTQRQENIHNAFITTSTLDPRHQVILLIDDIYTTGSTINECTKVLISAGAKQVYSCVVCIGSLGL